MKISRNSQESKLDEENDLSTLTQLSVQIFGEYRSTHEISKCKR